MGCGPEAIATMISTMSSVDQSTRAALFLGLGVLWFAGCFYVAWRWPSEDAEFEEALEGKSKDE
jgi:hypothetical protein